MRTDQIALQLYTMREAAKDDLLGTLTRVAEAGYRAVEFAGFHGVAPAQIRATLDKHGIRAMGAHVQLSEFETRLDGVLTDLQTLGCDYAIVPGLPEDRRGAETVPALAAAFNEIGARCQESGLRFAYHNHAFEFEIRDAAGATFWELLVAATDPGSISFELDAYWVQFAGYNPVTIIDSLAGRVPLLHLKDMDPTDRTKDAPFGEGSLPWPPILAAAGRAGVAWYVVEQDVPRDPLEDITTSLRNAEKMTRA